MAEPSQIGLVECGEGIMADVEKLAAHPMARIGVGAEVAKVCRKIVAYQVALAKSIEAGRADHGKGQ